MLGVTNNKRQCLDRVDHYYVYILFDWRGIPRYVGKGKRYRWNQHETRSDPINWMKNEFIEQTYIMLGEIPKIKVRENISNDEAIETEIALIKAIGRFPDGPLVNMTDGGDGIPGATRSGSPRGELHPMYGKKHTEESKIRMRLSLKDRVAWNKDKKGWSGPGSFKKGFVWITDGISNKLVAPYGPLLEGWSYGVAPKKDTITALLKNIGIPHNTFYSRIRLGWSVEDALNTPVRPRRPNGG